MRPMGIAFALLSLGSLLGCSGTPATKTVEAASTAPQHNFQLFGSLEKGQFMVDEVTGTVWQLDEATSAKRFVPIEVVWPETAGPPPGAKIRDWSKLQ
jgi:hypothetical protein